MQELKEEFEKSGGKFEEIKLGDLFEVKSNPQLNKRSFTFCKDGEYPYFTRTVANNGILGYVKYLDEAHKIKGNSLAVGMLGMKFFYMKRDFYAGQFTKTIFPKFSHFNERIALYFIALLNKCSKLFLSVLVRDFENIFSKTAVCLPVTRERKLAFSYMEQYISEVEAEIVRELEAYLAASGLSDCELTKEEGSALEKSLSFEEFRIGELFEVKSTNGKINAHNVAFDGHTPYVVRQAGNNGIRGYIDADPSLKNEKNTISFGQDTATIFYQPDDYFTGDKIKVLKLNVSGATLNEEIACFIIAAMKKAFQGFSWGVSSFDEKIIKGTKISLPVIKEDIDFAYMQAYISAIKKLVIADVVKWKERELAAMREAVDATE